MASTDPQFADLPLPDSTWRRHGWASLVAGLGSAVVGCGSLWLARRCGSAPATAGLLSLLATTVWIGLVCALIAAGTGDTLGALLRGGCAVDGSVVTVIATAIWGGGLVGWAGGLKAYLLWAAMGASLVLFTRLGRSAIARGSLAAVGSTLAALAMGSLFWSAGLLNALAGPARQAVAGWLIRVNTLAGVAAAAGAEGSFPWTWPLMYNITRLGQDVPAPPFSWWMPLCVWAVVAAGLSGYLLIRHGWRRFLYGT